MKKLKIEEWELSSALLDLERLQDGDPEDAHKEADSILTDLLLSMGLEEIVEAYNDIPKWYA